MTRKNRPFIIDANLNSILKSYLPLGARTTTEYGLRQSAPDNPDIIYLCQRERAILVTADARILQHFRDYQRAHNSCCWGLLLLPDGELHQIDILRRLRAGKLKLKHPRDDVFRFEDVRNDNLLVNLRTHPPEIGELCNCEWQED